MRARFSSRRTRRSTRRNPSRGRRKLHRRGRAGTAGRRRLRIGHRM